MTHEADDPIQYSLSLDEKPTPLNPALDKPFSIRFLNKITCVECGRSIKKTYDEGYCFPCARDLPQNAMCSVRPEKCEHENGSEQDREFFQAYCNVDHFVYLSLTSTVKVGVTRHWNIPSRWIDQGAVRGLVIAKTPERKLAGQIEVALAEHMADKTNWRKMLKGEVEDIDLADYREEALGWVPKALQSYILKKEPVHTLNYPVLSVPPKIVSHNLDKENELSGHLTGVKGQYLIFENRVINLRKYSGYHVEFTWGK